MTDLQLQKMMELWKAYYRSRGIAPEFANQCLAYARSLLKQDMPVIFDLPHLCLLLGLDVSYLHSIVYVQISITVIFLYERKVVVLESCLHRIIP